MAESDPPPPIEEYCSTYDNQFFKPGFEVDDEFYKKDVEVIIYDERETLCRLQCH